jgi:hypothetical protein
LAFPLEGFGFGYSSSSSSTRSISADSAAFFFLVELLFLFFFEDVGEPVASIDAPRDKARAYKAMQSVKSLSSGIFTYGKDK